MTKLLRKLTHDVPALTENSVVALRVLTNHYERCGRYYGSGGMGGHGIATDEERQLTMMLFSGIFDSLAKRVSIMFSFRVMWNFFLNFFISKDDLKYISLIDMITLQEIQFITGFIIFSIYYKGKLQYITRLTGHMHVVILYVYIDTYIIVLLMWSFILTSAF